MRRIGACTPEITEPRAVSTAMSGTAGTLAVAASVALFPNCWCPRVDSNHRTWFRKPMLYPLSYEGGDGAERGAKLGATARKP